MNWCSKGIQLLALLWISLLPALGQVRLHAEEGWEVPGLKKLLTGPAQQQETLQWNGTAVRARSYLLPATGPGRLPSYRLLQIRPRGGTQYVSWVQVAPKVVRAFTVDQKLFAVMVEGVVQMPPDPKTGHGGYGGEVQVYYLDVDRSGILKLLVEQMPATRRPEIPNWVQTRETSR